MSSNKSSSSESSHQSLVRCGRYYVDVDVVSDALGRAIFNDDEVELGAAVVVIPFVALFQPMILAAGGTTARLMALAAGSTIAGNLTILGAASNVIIIQNAEKEGETLGFYEFARVGVPLTIIQICIFAGWLAVVG